MIRPDSRIFLSRGIYTDKDNIKKFVTGYYVYLKKNKFIKNDQHKIFTPDDLNENTLEPKQYEIDFKTLCQFVLKYDSNKNEIFENDILRLGCYPFTDDNTINYYGIVCIDEEGPFIFCCKAKNSQVRGISDGINYDLNETIDEALSENDVEVIGNMFDVQTKKCKHFKKIDEIFEDPDFAKSLCGMKVKN